MPLFPQKRLHFAQLQTQKGRCFIKTFILMVLSTQVSVLSCRCIKHDNQWEQHNKPPLHRPLQKVSWPGGRPKGFQSFPASKRTCLGTKR